MNYWFVRILKNKWLWKRPTRVVRRIGLRFDQTGKTLWCRQVSKSWGCWWRWGCWGALDIWRRGKDRLSGKILLEFGLESVVANRRIRQTSARGSPRIKALCPSVGVLKVSSSRFLHLWRASRCPRLRQYLSSLMLAAWSCCGETESMRLQKNHLAT